MYVERNISPEGATTVALLQEFCVGCQDCTGPCIELLQLGLVPDLVTQLREDSSR